MSLLEHIDSPADLKKLNRSQLPALAEEIRAMLLDTVSRCGGHLAPSLGTVELTLALHTIYSTPADKIIWDVGHQAYTHKILTGRKSQFGTLRQYGGISGFPHTTESEHDALTVGHASTSISAALGMAVARDLQKQSHRIVSIIGDGSLSGGLAFEGLNNLGSSHTDMTVILNDNEMSIAPNVGGLSHYLTRIITDKRFNKLRTNVWEALGGSNVGKRIRDLVHNVDDMVKRAVTPGKFFEDLGIRYIGPIDGHNLDELLDVLSFAYEPGRGPLLIHVLTTKGKGYSFAEDNATKFHGIGKFEVDTGDEVSSAGLPVYSDVFGKTLVDIAGKNEKVVAVTAAMPDGTGLQHFRDIYPQRLFDVGIAEGHAVTFSAGLALRGMIPVVALYSSFLQRAYDNLIHDVALDNVHVVFGIDRAGLVGADGPTHHGCFDLSFLRTIPGATIMAPADEAELAAMLHHAIDKVEGPVFIRYPRGTGPGKNFTENLPSIETGRAELRRSGSSCAIVAIGDAVQTALKAASILSSKGIEATVINARFVKPFDSSICADLFKTHSLIITLEHNALAGGFGSAVLECAAEHQSKARIVRLGYPDHFIDQGPVDRLHADLGLSAEKVADRIAAEYASL